MMYRLMLLLCLVAIAQVPTKGELDAALVLEIFGSSNQTFFDQDTEAPQKYDFTRVSATKDAVQVDQSANPIVDTSCVTETGEDGECVQYYLCDDNSTIKADGVGIIDIRIRNGPCDSYLESCCVPRDRRQSNQPILPIANDQLEQPQSTECGWRNPDGVGFRIKGDYNNEAKFGEFPWMVAVLRDVPTHFDYLNRRGQYFYLGGGSLIHHSVVLTAAHYLANETSLVARMGEWDTQTENEIYPIQDRSIAEVQIHKDFNSGNLFYDIALLFLESPAHAAPNVGLVCLPQPGDRPAANIRCFASGWGKDKFGKDGSYQLILKKVDLPVVDHCKCQEQLRRTTLGRYFLLHSTFMCAGGEPSKDTCKGDGGSPLACPIEHQANRYRQYGIVAWGIQCGEDGTPGVYSDVTSLRGWIDAAVIARGYDPGVYTA